MDEDDSPEISYSTISFAYGISLKYVMNTNTSYVPALVHGHTGNPSGSSSSPGNKGYDINSTNICRITFRDNAMFWPGLANEINAAQRPALHKLHVTYSNVSICRMSYRGRICNLF